MAFENEIKRLQEAIRSADAMGDDTGRSGTILFHLTRQYGRQKRIGMMATAQMLKAPTASERLRGNDPRRIRKYDLIAGK